MAYSTIKLYGDVSRSGANSSFPLIRERLMAVDNLEDMVSPYLLKTIPEFQRIKHDLNIIIKVDMSQSYGDNGDNGNYYRYIGIKNSDEDSTFYYYVTKSEVLGEETIRFTLEFDSINNCLEVNSNKKLHFTKRTKVTRAHRDRFFPTSQSRKARNIPLESEGIYPVLYKTKEDRLNNLQGGEIGARNWYLIYRTEYLEETKPQGISNPVKCYLLNDAPIIIQSAGGQTSAKINDLSYQLASRGYNSLIFSSLTLGNSGSVSYGGITRSLGEKETLIIYYDGTPGRRFYGVWILKADGSVDSASSKSFTIEDFEISFSGSWDYGYFLEGSGDVYESKSNYRPNNTFELLYRGEEANVKYSLDMFNEAKTIPFSALDRTDARLVKIICLPYCPIHYTINDLGVFNSEASWVFDSGMIRITDINQKFNVDLSGVIPNVEGTCYNSVLSFTPEKGTPRYITDSKVYHSDYYYKKYVYDSFSYTIQLEKVCSTTPRGFLTSYNKVFLKFSVSNGIASRMLFNVNPFTTRTSFFDSYDYDYIFYVSRNNEVTMFDSSYLNYIRTGFNYDVKNKNRQEAVSWIGTALGIAGTIGGIASGNAVLTATSITGTLASITTAISSTIAAETNLESKLQQLRNQSVSVANADDISLLEEYSGNKVTLETWEVSPNMKSLLDDLFFYTGYIDNRFYIPTHNNRLYFDFLSCEPEFECSYNWNAEILSDLSDKLRAGITFFHKVDGAWDFSQTFENFEISLLN